MKFILVMLLFISLLYSKVSYSRENSHEKVKNGEVGIINVKIKKKSNNYVEICYRVPKKYDRKSKKLYRILIYLTWRWPAGERKINDHFQFIKWADENDIFLVALRLHKKDRNPNNGSGQSFFKAIDKLKAIYPNIFSERMFYFGYSGGAEVANMLAEYAPERCLAWFAQGCGVWHKPSSKMKNIPGFVVCGNADVQRYILSRSYIKKYHKYGEKIIFKTTENAGHDVQSEFIGKNAIVFFNHYNELHKYELDNSSRPINMLNNHVKEKMRYIGDDQDGVFYKISKENIAKIKMISNDDRILFPSLELAKAWGKEGKIIK